MASIERDVEDLQDDFRRLRTECDQLREDLKKALQRVSTIEDAVWARLHETG